MYKQNVNLLGRSIGICVASIMSFNLCVSGQDIETIADEKPIRVNGSVSVAQSFYHAVGKNTNRDPYNYYLNGNLNVSLYGIQVPLSFSYSNRQATFQQPFNQYGISPRYKWVTVHAGYRTMTFSPYTLNGHTFLGAGVEVAPGSMFRASAMYGRLQKAVQADTTLGAERQPVFERYGYGVKLGLVKDTDYGHVIIFKAQDKLNSVANLSESSLVMPRENLVMGFAGRKTIVKGLALVVDWAASAMTRDLRSESSERVKHGILQTMGGLFTYRTSSSVSQAFKSSLNYARNAYQIGVNYERVDPGYETLGSYYFNNDLENITINSSIRLARASLSANVGIQRNDLDNTKVSKMNRFVGSINASLSPSDRLQTNLSFSNFRAYTRLRPRFEDYVGTPQNAADTISSRYTQISQTANASVTYRLGNSKNTINTLFTLTSTSDDQDSVQRTSNLYYATTTYNFVLPAIQLSAHVGVNVNVSDEPNGQRVAIGPTCQGNKDFFEKKLRTAVALSYNKVLDSNTTRGGIVNVRVTSGYKVKKKHNVNVSVITSTYREKVADKVISDLMGNLNYAYSF